MIKKGFLLLLIGLLFLSGSFTISCTSDLEQQEIITFTQQALEIEAKRSELMIFYAGLQDKIGRTGAAWVMERFLFAGVPINALLKDAPPYVLIPSDLERMVSLQNKLLLLECPQSIQHIKDTLVYIYNSEVQLAESDLKLIRPKDNIGYLQQEFDRFDQQIKQQDPNYYNHQEFRMRDYYSILLKSPWGQAQKLRQQLYLDWAEILQEYGIDPAEEGFTELVGQE